MPDNTPISKFYTNTTLGKVINESGLRTPTAHLSRCGLLVRKFRAKTQNLVDCLFGGGEMKDLSSCIKIALIADFSPSHHLKGCASH